MEKKLSSIVVKLFVYLIIFYQNFISSLMIKRCLFYPSCSEYAKLVLIKNGFLKGLFLIIKRLIKCHPYT
ncbi:Putative membrane protein insertion efficiency factor [Buchnera aphidicola (Tetraneura ulmi)]|uniref:membrane protein insertion efficiency factor YidD n=1 Tax=Buchnera aphidicola TaxID=9 RepID=UPI003464E41F